VSRANDAEPASEETAPEEEAASPEASAVESFRLEEASERFCEPERLCEEASEFPRFCEAVDSSAKL
jgi:hypothetical protein